MDRVVPVESQAEICKAALSLILPLHRLDQAQARALKESPSPLQVVYNLQILSVVSHYQSAKLSQVLLSHQTKSQNLDKNVKNDRDSQALTQLDKCI